MFLVSMLTSDFYEEFWVSLRTRFHLSPCLKFQRSCETRRERNEILRRFSPTIRLTLKTKLNRAIHWCNVQLNLREMIRNDHQTGEILGLKYFRYFSLLWEKESERIHWILPNENYLHKQLCFYTQQTLFSNYHTLSLLLNDIIKI